MIMNYYMIQVSDVNKNLKNPSVDGFALRAFVLMSWLCACEQAPVTSPAIPTRCFATKDIYRGKTPFRYAPLKKLRTAEIGFLARSAGFCHS